jgi:hypothetical protein
MVNFSKVKVLRKEKEGLVIELDSKDIPDIPISKTYSEKIIQALSNYLLQWHYSGIAKAGNSHFITLRFRDKKCHTLG